MRTSVYKQFTFEAAHHLPAQFEATHPNWRLHGHSFRVRVWISANVDEHTKMTRDLGEIAEALEKIRLELDHQYLNDIEGLEQPTLEAIGAWILDRCKECISGTSCVEVHRDTCQEGCRVET